MPRSSGHCHPPACVGRRHAGRSSGPLQSGQSLLHWQAARASGERLCTSRKSATTQTTYNTLMSFLCFKNRHMRLQTAFKWHWSRNPVKFIQHECTNRFMKIVFSYYCTLWFLHPCLWFLQVSLATVIFVASQSSLSAEVKTVIKQQLENVANGWTVYRIARQASRMVISPACISLLIRYSSYSSWQSLKMYVWRIKDTFEHFIHIDYHLLISCWWVCV